MDSAAPLPPQTEPPQTDLKVPQIGLVDNAIGIMQDFAQRAPFLSVTVHALAGIGLYVVLSNLRHR